MVSMRKPTCTAPCPPSGIPPGLHRGELATIGAAEVAVQDDASRHPESVAAQHAPRTPVFRTSSGANRPRVAKRAERAMGNQTMQQPDQKRGEEQRCRYQCRSEVAGNHRPHEKPHPGEHQQPFQEEQPRGDPESPDTEMIRQTIHGGFQGRVSSKVPASSKTGLWELFENKVICRPLTVPTESES